MSSNRTIYSERLFSTTGRVLSRDDYRAYNQLPFQS
ncbi:hypothetical protein PPL_02596 [Heterostelium album PN500]|uniref:Uncharacterized protein n=1 Tax=Heterostelium pallidum (strain ATCC 26659 / Pp 5 / PN500) TaxID=670386 RepID=D3B2I3_HETP5|nr:hypothetical protein PPL_02596 [Heterostelium album PN500]EFA83531.1 hypothetical protein PPL_02596 [Heterostelium album PN500]|eukprot:XP_020435648.1 hypothetical protein PPL_02596 [Heterostelium album PN500]